jgi:16S rRNA pseudouridine516 synthase
MERLDKFLCDSGVGTRSQVKPMIKSGRVTVAGTVVRDPSFKFDPSVQPVSLDGEVLGGRRRVVAMLHKPAGYVTATSDPVEKTVMELLPPELLRQDVKPVGRLDKETEGLLLFTNDGDLLHRLISPGKEVPKVYYARHEGTATGEDVKAFAEGITLKDGTLCRSAVLEPLGEGESRITVCEGKYHQVRRMMASRGMHVTYLKRCAEADLTLGDLPLGSVRELTEQEIKDLDKAR